MVQLGREVIRCITNRGLVEGGSRGYIDYKPCGLLLLRWIYRTFICGDLRAGI
jgi:hypothetical protein